MASRHEARIMEVGPIISNQPFYKHSERRPVCESSGSYLDWEARLGDCLRDLGCKLPLALCNHLEQWFLQRRVRILICSLRHWQRCGSLCSDNACPSPNRLHIIGHPGYYGAGQCRFDSNLQSSLILGNRADILLVLSCTSNGK